MRHLGRDRVAVVCAAIVAAYLMLVLAAMLGWAGRDWQTPAGLPYAPPALLATGGDAAAMVRSLPARQRAMAGTNDADIRDIDPLAARQGEIADREARDRGADQQARALHDLPFGGDRWGRDVLAKTIQGSKISIVVGVVGALLAVTFGTALGALAGYFGGRVDAACEWLYNVIEAVPSILLIFALAAVLARGTSTVIGILALTGWTGTYRLVRAEYMRHRSREYVRAAEAIGVGHGGRMFRHILPNISHVILVRLSLLVILFIKAEVILSFLGFGVPVDEVSWGTMLGEAQTELVNGRWWQLAAAGTAMAVFVTAFSLLTDSLRDALDPTLR